MDHIMEIAKLIELERIWFVNTKSFLIRENLAEEIQIVPYTTQQKNTTKYERIWCVQSI